MGKHIDSFKQIINENKKEIFEVGDMILYNDKYIAKVIQKESK